MDTCDGSYGDNHEWVAFTNDMGCPLCAMRDYKNGIIAARDEEIKELESQIDDAVVERVELEEKLAQYDGLDEAIKKMVKERM